MKIELAQVAPKPRDPSANLKVMIDQLRESPAELIVYPELFLSGYQIENLPELAFSKDHELFSDLSQLCFHLGKSLIFGFIESEDEQFYDSVAAIDWKTSAPTILRKTHLFGSENDVFGKGEVLQPVRVNGVPLGILNCVELEYPEIARTLRLRGAQALIAVSANMDPYFDEHKVAGQARVFENRIPLAYVNRIGKESGFTFCGGSRIIDGLGAVQIEAPSREEAHLIGEFPLQVPQVPELDQLTWRRPELYER